MCLSLFQMDMDPDVCVEAIFVVGQQSMSDVFVSFRINKDPDVCVKDKYVVCFLISTRSFVTPSR